MEMPVLYFGLNNESSEVKQLLINNKINFNIIYMNDKTSSPVLFSLETLKGYKGINEIIKYVSFIKNPKIKPEVKIKNNVRTGVVLSSGSIFNPEGRIIEWDPENDKIIREGINYLNKLNAIEQEKKPVPEEQYDKTYIEPLENIVTDSKEKTKYKKGKNCVW